jgi:hypothetical protein
MVTVTIGPITTIYVFVETTAPTVYDGHGTFTICDGEHLLRGAVERLWERPLGGKGDA